MIRKSHVEEVWDKLAYGKFHPAVLRPVKMGRAAFQVLFTPRNEEFKPDVYMPSGLSFCVYPRLAAYCHRLVLIPRENLAGLGRWEIHLEDIADWMKWCTHMNHVVTMSTLKSGASCPLSLHAQSFPFLGGDGVILSALAGVLASVLIDFGEMPHFEELRIEALVDYPVNGLRISGRNTELGHRQVAEKVYELALNYDALKAFNLVMLPNDGGTPYVHFFPRPLDGQVTYGDRRWQIAGIECNGLMQAKSEEEADSLDEDGIRKIFSGRTMNDDDFAEFQKLVNTF